MAGSVYSGWSRDRRGWLIAICVSASVHAGVFLHFMNSGTAPVRPDLPPRITLSLVMTVAAPAAIPAEPSPPVLPAPSPETADTRPGPQPREVRAAQPVRKRPAPPPEPQTIPVPQQSPSVVASAVAAMEIRPEPATLVIEPPRVDAAYLRNPPPVYPRLLQRRGVEGSVLVRARVENDGRCSEVLLQESSGFPQFDAAALAAVQDWRFIPARQGAQAVVAWVEIPIDFRITRAN